MILNFTWQAPKGMVLVEGCFDSRVGEEIKVCIGSEALTGQLRSAKIVEGGTGATLEVLVPDIFIPDSVVQDAAGIEPPRARLHPHGIATITKTP